MTETPPSIVRSEPNYDEEAVIDVDFGFASGVVKSFTLHPQLGDSLKVDSEQTTLTVHDAGGIEILGFYHRALAWSSSRQRVIRTRRPGPPTASESPAPAV